jgi:hypothetical protein
MTPDFIQAGLRITTMNRSSAGMITRVTRSRWRQVLLRFWIIWDHAPGEAEYLPGDEKNFREELA